VSTSDPPVLKASAAFTKNKRSHDLGKMTYRQLWVAYFTYPAVLTYIALSAAAIYGSVATGAADDLLPPFTSAVIAVLIYPLVWYGLHRFVLHSRFLYRFPATAKLWKRIHFDHHQDPHRLDVLFGSLTNTLPTIAIATLPIGYLIGGWPAAFSALAAGLITTLVYEYCHCIQHLGFQPKNRWLKRIKALHMAHHFHNEQGNYGIISFWADDLLGSQYEPGEKPRSKTVFNLGYDEAEAARYPWVAALAPDRRPEPKGPAA